VRLLLLVFIIDHSAWFVNSFFSIFPKKTRKKQKFFFYKKEKRRTFFYISVLLVF